MSTTDQVVPMGNNLIKRLFLDDLDQNEAIEVGVLEVEEHSDKKQILLRFGFSDGIPASPQPIITLQNLHSINVNIHPVRLKYGIECVVVSDKEIKKTMATDSQWSIVICFMYRQCKGSEENDPPAPLIRIFARAVLNGKINDTLDQLVGIMADGFEKAAQSSWFHG